MTSRFCSKFLISCNKLNKCSECERLKNNKHKQVLFGDKRLSPSKRGYGSEWKKIREKVLKSYGIPKEKWSLYDIDHNPAYNPEIEPNHTKYNLIPRLHSEHSRKTALCDVRRDSKGNFIKK